MSKRTIDIDGKTFNIKKAKPSPLKSVLKPREMTNPYSKLFKQMEIGDAVDLKIDSKDPTFLKAYTYAGKSFKGKGKKISYRSTSKGITAYCVAA